MATTKAVLGELPLSRSEAMVWWTERSAPQIPRGPIGTRRRPSVLVESTSTVGVSFAGIALLGFAVGPAESCPERPFDTSGIRKTFSPSRPLRRVAWGCGWARSGEEPLPGAE